MNTWRIIITLFSLLALVGCGAISDATSGVRERLGERDVGQTRSYPQARRVVYDSVQAAAAQMGYRLVRGGPAQGEFEGISRVNAGETMGSARQLVLKARLVDSLDGGTDLTVRITEIIESDSSNRPGLATETPLRDTPQYNVFFHAVDRALQPTP